MYLDVLQHIYVKEVWVWKISDCQIDVEDEQMKISHWTIAKNRMIRKLGTEVGMAIRIDRHALLIEISGPSENT